VTPKAESICWPTKPSRDHRRRRNPAEDSTALAECPAKHKFLFIRFILAIDDPYLADLARDLPRRVIADWTRFPDVKRSRSLSCQSGQTPLVSPDLGRSVFSHYVDESLRGWADFDDAALDDRGQVTAHRLAHFVRPSSSLGNGEPADAANAHSHR